MVEIWDRKASGVLHEETLLLRACRAGAYGSRVRYDGGDVCQAHFTYLSGRPDRVLFEERPELFFDRLLVCMSPEWERFIQQQPALDAVLLRRLMDPMCRPSAKTLPALPAGYRIGPFDADAFSAHPYGHGSVYGSYEAFAARGSGAVAWFGDRIVASASSHLTFGDDVELDVTTDAGHRRKGLADHCVRAMIDDCAARGLTVHWDAKNTPSMNMAQGHGFTLRQEYAVYILKP
ncbi:MAG: GNAT family N-acetyltransferase [Clostridia bacterium]|nr:GNAT family N-acetyltransferase [Clostridia bacterium]